MQSQYLEILGFAHFFEHFTFDKTYTELSVKHVIRIEEEEQAYRKFIFLKENEFDCSELLSYLQGILKKNTPKRGITELRVVCNASF